MLISTRRLSVACAALTLAAAFLFGATASDLRAAPDTPVLVTPAEAQARLSQDKHVRVLDVRTPEEYAAGHLAGAILLPVDQVDEQAEAVLKDHAQPTLVYCHSGSRSARAVAKLKAKGYAHLMDLKGGIVAWSQAGNATAKQ